MDFHGDRRGTGSGIDEIVSIIFGLQSHRGNVQGTLARNGS